MIQQQNCSNSIGFLILHFKRGNSNVSWDRWTLNALQHKRCSDSINIALCHAWIQNFFSGGWKSDIYLCLLGVMVPAIFSVILLCKFQKFEFSRISPDTPLSFARSTQCHQLLLCWQFLACVFYRAVEIPVLPNNKQIHLSWVSTYN